MRTPLKKSGPVCCSTNRFEQPGFIVGFGEPVVIGFPVLSGFAVVFDGHSELEQAIFLQNLTCIRAGGGFAGDLTMYSIFN